MINGPEAAVATGGTGGIAAAGSDGAAGSGVQNGPTSTAVTTAADAPDGPDESKTWVRTGGDSKSAAGVDAGLTGAPHVSQ